LVSKEDAENSVGTPGITNSGGRPRGTYYLYLRQNGLWCREITGFDPTSERARLDPYCPVRNITPSYPPILMVHGTDDTDVPYQESADMAAAVAAKGVEHELITVEHGGHGLGGADEKAIANAHARAIEFMRNHLK
jgi:dipeptidyl aminopeptidase/acylaminoacyl peptidase